MALADSLADLEKLGERLGRRYRHTGPGGDVALVAAAAAKVARDLEELVQPPELDDEEQPQPAEGEPQPGAGEPPQPPQPAEGEPQAPQPPPIQP